MALLPGSHPRRPRGKMVGATESLNGRKNKARRKVKNGKKRNWSGKTLSPGALLAVLDFSFVPYFSACLDFPSPPLSAHGSLRMPESMTW